MANTDIAVLRADLARSLTGPVIKGDKRTMRRIIAIAVMAAALLAALGLTGCGSSQPVTYAPAAYGVPGHCYYIQDPAEAIALQQAGLCPHGWAPTLAPLYWQEEYYSYYSSPAYYGHYVPARVRTVYVTRERTFSTTYRSSIRTASARATYKGSNGSTVTGNKVAKARFGPGTTGTSFGGGKRSGSGTSGYSGSRSGSRPGTSGGSRSFGGGKR